MTHQTAQANQPWYQQAGSRQAGASGTAVANPSVSRLRAAGGWMAAPHPHGSDAVTNTGTSAMHRSVLASVVQSAGSTGQTDSAGGKGEGRSCGEGVAPTAAKGPVSARALHPQRSARRTAAAHQQTATAPAFACCCHCTRSGKMSQRTALSHRNRAPRRAPCGCASPAHVLSGAYPPFWVP
jgi:hypothetical protein